MTMTTARHWTAGSSKTPTGLLRGQPCRHRIPQIWSSPRPSKATSRIHNIWILRQRSQSLMTRAKTKPDPYHFTIVIDTIKCPFSIVDCFASLHASNFDDVVKALEEEIIEKKWQKKKGKALKAKPLAKKLRNVVGALGVTAVVAKAKTSRPQKGPLASGVTGTESQVHNQASIQVQTGIQRGSRSNE